jgi:sec-independent protein translocase protein TatB
MIGPLEIMLVGVVALLVFGPEKLPEMARTVGRTANQLRRMAADLKEEFNAELEDDEDDPEPRSRAAPTNAAPPDTEGAEVEPDDDVHDDVEPDEALGREDRLRNDLTARDPGTDG